MTYKEWEVFGLEFLPEMTDDEKAQAFQSVEVRPMFELLSLDSNVTASWPTPPQQEDLDELDKHARWLRSSGWDL